MGRKRKRKISLLDFAFAEEPIFTPRTPYYWMSDEELQGISKYYLILDKDCPFKFTVKIDAETYSFDATIPKGFTYNMADIPPFLQFITYDRHYPFVKNASFIHDYLCSRKRVLYEEWNLKEQGISGAEFRNMTTLIFCHVLKQNAVPYKKAHLMAFCVNLFQSLIYEWYTLDKTETTLWQ